MRWLKRSVSFLVIVTLPGAAVASDASVTLKQAREAIATARNAEAISLYARYLKLEPDDSQARVEFAQVLSWEGRYEEAIKEYEGVLAEQPQNHDARFGLAQALAWSGKTTRALDQLELLLKAQPGEPRYRLLRAQALSWGGRLDEAISSYRHILEDDGENAVAWSGLGDAYRWAEKPQKAEEAYGRALSLDPTVDAAKALPALLADKRFVVILPTAARFRDADGISVWWSGIGARGKLDWHWSSQVAYDASLIARGGENVTRHRLVLGAERVLGDFLKVEAEYLLSSYNDGEETHGARLNFQAPLPGGGTAQLRLSRADIFDDVLTFGSVADKVLYGYIGRGDLWRGLPWGFDVSAGGIIGRYSDENEVASGNFSLGYTVSSTPFIGVSYGFFLLSYREGSPRYWSPGNYRSHGLRVSSSYKLLRYLRLEAEGHLGQGNEDGQSTVEFGGSGGAKVELPGRLSAAFQYQYGESARVSAGGGSYWSQRWSIDLSYRF